jgi:hypothetical protein
MTDPSRDFNFKCVGHVFPAMDSTGTLFVLVEIEHARHKAALNTMDGMPVLHPLAVRDITDVMVNEICAAVGGSRQIVTHVNEITFVYVRGLSAYIAKEVAHQAAESGAAMAKNTGSDNKNDAENDADADADVLPPVLEAIIVQRPLAISSYELFHPYWCDANVQWHVEQLITQQTGAPPDKEWMVAQAVDVLQSATTYGRSPASTETFRRSIYDSKGIIPFLGLLQHECVVPSNRLFITVNLLLTLSWQGDTNVATEIGIKVQDPAVLINAFSTDGAKKVFTVLHDRAAEVKTCHLIDMAGPSQYHVDYKEWQARRQAGHYRTDRQPAVPDEVGPAGV